MVMIVLSLAILGVAGIAGWATVAAARSLSGGKGDDEAELRIEELTAVLSGLQADFDDLARKQETDREALDERIDFAERLLTRGPDEPAP